MLDAGSEGRAARVPKQGLWELAGLPQKPVGFRLVGPA